MYSLLFFRRKNSTLEAADDAAFGQIVGRHLHQNFVSWQQLDKMQPHPPRDMRENNVPLADLMFYVVVDSTIKILVRGCRFSEICYLNTVDV